MRGRGGYQGPIEGLPELMAACEGKEGNFTSMVKEVLQPNQISQVRHATYPRCEANSTRFTKTSNLLAPAAFLDTVERNILFWRLQTLDESSLNNINIQINSNSPRIRQRAQARDLPKAADSHGGLR